MKKLLKYLVDLIIRIESVFVRQETVTKKRLLILRKDGLGDYILFYPTLKYYREIYPDHEIFLVVSTIAKDLTEKMPWVDHFILFDKNRFSSSFSYRKEFLLDLRRKNFSSAIYPVVTRERAGDFMISLTKAKERIAFDTATDAKNIYTRLINLPENINREIDADAHFARALGADIQQIEFPTIALVDKDMRAADNIIEENGLSNKPFCIIFPGSNYRFKVWPPAKHAEIIRFLIGKGITPVVCGGRSEIDLVEEIRSHLGDTDRFIDLVGKTENLFALAGLLKKAKFYFGSDTGIAHLSAAVLTPTICLMGGGHFGRFFPYGDLARNRIVYDHDMACMNDNWKCVKDILGNDPAPCIRDIKTEEVKKEIENLLKTIKS